jgi:hypothetical protein
MPGLLTHHHVGMMWGLRLRILAARTVAIQLLHLMHSEHNSRPCRRRPQATSKPCKHPHTMTRREHYLNAHACVFHQADLSIWYCRLLNKAVHVRVVQDTVVSGWPASEPATTIQLRTSSHTRPIPYLHAG